MKNKCVKAVMLAVIICFCCTPLVLASSVSGNFNNTNVDLANSASPFADVSVSINTDATSTTTPSPTPMESVSPPVPGPILNYVKFNKKKVVVKKGKKLNIKLSSVGADMDECIKRIKFTVNKKKVVKIVKINKKKITIKGLKKGTATITLKLAGKRSKCKVKVK